MWLNRPQLRAVEQPYYDAFAVLSRARGISAGMSVVVEQALVLSEITTYAKDKGYSAGFELDRFVKLIQGMDEVWRDVASKKREEALRAANTKGRR